MWCQKLRGPLTRQYTEPDFRWRRYTEEIMSATRTLHHSHRTLFDHPVCLLPPGPPADEGDDDGSGRQDLGDDAGNELGGVRRGSDQYSEGVRVHDADWTGLTQMMVHLTSSAASALVVCDSISGTHSNFSGRDASHPPRLCWTGRRL
jgi:hypothetical protein